MAFQSVLDFEQQIAQFFGSPYAVATDSCTHALELAMRYSPAEKYTCPVNTYISVPFTFNKLGVQWKFEKYKWQDFYYICPNIIDAAVYWKEKGYIPDTLMCLSFQFKKHLGLGRGGAILCSNKQDWIALKKLSYDGRLPDNTAWADQNIDSIGYHYYMTPETAEIGLEKLPRAIREEPKKWSNKDYPNLTEIEIFKGIQTDSRRFARDEKYNVIDK